jgi:two-component system response regulator MprA
MASILVVEGHDPVRLALARLLRLEGHEVRQAADGDQALANFATAPCDLVLMDVYMPRMDGLEACRRMRQRANVPILLLCTNWDPGLQKQARLCGASGFLSKPLQFDQLLAWMHNMSPSLNGAQA